MLMSATLPGRDEAEIGNVVHQRGLAGQPIDRPIRAASSALRRTQWPSRCVWSRAVSSVRAGRRSRGCRSQVTETPRIASRLCDLWRSIAIENRSARFRRAKVEEGRPFVP